MSDEDRIKQFVPAVGNSPGAGVEVPPELLPIATFLQEEMAKAQVELQVVRERGGGISIEADPQDDAEIIERMKAEGMTEEQARAELAEVDRLLQEGSGAATPEELLHATNTVEVNALVLRQLGEKNYKPVLAHLDHLIKMSERAKQTPVYESTSQRYKDEIEVRITRLTSLRNLLAGHA